MSPETSRRSQFGLYVRTIRHLRPQQIAWRARLRVQRRLLASPAGAPLRRLIESGGAPRQAGWPVTFSPLDEQRFQDPRFAADFVDGRITLLSSRAELARGWQHLDQPQLWRYHLHYWDWAWHLHASMGAQEFCSVFGKHYRAWKRANSLGRGDAWSPYVVSLRLWTLCGLHRTLAADAELGREIAKDIRATTRLLRWHCEYDVGGNHLLKNLKAIAGGAVFVDDERLLTRAMRAIERQIAVQVLKDGGHYERSPAYHAQVLGDLIDIERLLATAANRPPDAIQTAIANMRQWLHVMAGPHRMAPAFNDGPSVGPDELNLLGVYPAPHDRLRWLAESGYVVANPSNRVHLVMDVGDPCPDELPAHAHADCLSFTLTVDGTPIVIDTGSSEYGAGQRRSYERSTAAHNTVEIDGSNQTEVWGAFRAATRARPRVLQVELSGDLITVDAEHDGYSRLAGRPIPRRRLTVSPTELTVIDSVRGGSMHTATSRLHIASGPPVNSVASGQTSLPEGIRVSAAWRNIVSDAGTYATAFGEHLPCVRLTQQQSGQLPHDLSWVLTWTKPAPATAGRSEESAQ